MRYPELLFAGVGALSLVGAWSSGPAPLALEIQVDGVARVGEPVPLQAALVNQGSRSLAVLPDLDASDYAWRGPVVRWVVHDPDGELVDLRMGRCGNWNDLRADDFVELHPGGAVPVAGVWADLSWWTPDRPGVWTFELVYDTRSRTDFGQSWVHLPQLLRLPGVILVSDEVRVDVRPERVARLQ